VLAWSCNNQTSTKVNCKTVDMGNTKVKLPRSRKEGNMKSKKLTPILGSIIVCSCLTLITEVVAQEKLIEDVEIRGNRTITREEILKRIKTEPGKIYRENQVKEDFRRVMDIGAFDRLQSKVVTEKAPRDRVIVIFILKELPKQ